MTVLDEIGSELSRQEEFWGHDFDDLNTPNDWVAYITRYVAEGAYGGRQQKYEVAIFRSNLVKAATLCVAAVETIDRLGELTPRHYDKQEVRSE